MAQNHPSRGVANAGTQSIKSRDRMAITWGYLPHSLRGQIFMSDPPLHPDRDSSGTCQRPSRDDHRAVVHERARLPLDPARLIVGEPLDTDEPAVAARWRDAYEQLIAVRSHAYILGRALEDRGGLGCAEVGPYIDFLTEELARLEAGRERWLQRIAAMGHSASAENVCDLPPSWGTVVPRDARLHGPG